LAFFLGGVRYHDQEYNPAATRVYSSMMLIAVISLVVPTAFSRFFSDASGTAAELGNSRRSFDRLRALSAFHARHPISSSFPLPADRVRISGLDERDPGRRG
jgi:Ca2+/H+ antiporter